MTVFRYILTITATLLLASQAVAQQAEPDQKALFASYLNSHVYKEYLEKVLNLGEPAILKAECATMRAVTYNRVIVLEQPKFLRAGANFNIDTGSWVALAVLDRRGSQLTRRALLKAIPGANQLQPTFLLPGDFRGNLKLEADAVRIVTPGLMAAAKCQDIAGQARSLDGEDCARGAGTDGGQQALKPRRIVPPPERPRSSSMTITFSQPSARARDARAY